MSSKVMAIVCLSVMAFWKLSAQQEFSDGYSRMIQLGLMHNDTLTQKDTSKQEDTVKKAAVILLKDL